jgi:hypothetical protein
MNRALRAEHPGASDPVEALAELEKAQPEDDPFDPRNFPPARPPALPAAEDQP